MIFKSYELKKINLNKSNLILFYGNNDQHKEDELKLLIGDNIISNFDQNEIIENQQIFFEDIYNISLFEDKKIIVVKRASDKILKTIQNIDLGKIGNTTIIFISDILEKKSKLRVEFEKNKKLICVPFYPDNKDTLLKMANNFFRSNNISISIRTINVIINKISNDRAALFNEMEKIKLYGINNKKIDEEKILKLINLNENHNITELVDSFLSKNKSKTIYILNENNYTNDDCVLIVRILLAKTKKLIQLLKSYEKNNDINLTISTAKPPIFWKDKEITKQQILKWKTKNIKILAYEINSLELLIKKNMNNSVKLLTNFFTENFSY